MDWKTFWDKKAALNANPQAQVGRIRGGLSLSEKVSEEIIDHIVDKLDLQANDSLLDLCCGNGFLTSKLSKHCKKIVAIDLSTEQIRQAKKQFSAANISYHTGNVTQSNFYHSDEKFDKINLFFAFQYFDHFQLGKKAITGILPYLKDGGTIFIGDVPNRKYLNRFYPNLFQQIRYHIHQLLGRNPMGKFWSEKEMQRIARDLGLKLSILPQPEHLPYANYRTDYLFVKTR